MNVSDSRALTESKQVSSTKSEDWQLLLSTLLNKDPSNPGFTVTVDEKNEAVVTTKDQALAAELTKTLASPEAVRAKINYTLESKDSKQVSPAATQPTSDAKLPELKHGMGQTIFEQMFGNANLQRIGCPLWEAELKDDTHFVTTAPCETGLEELPKNQIQKYRKMLATASFQELREAVAQKKPLKLKPDTALPGPLAQNVDKILYTTKTQDGKTMACFDYGLLMACLAQPQLKAIQTADKSYQFKINLNQLMSYLSTVLSEGFILQIAEKDGQPQARPICFNPGRALPLQIVMSFVLDCSGSMDSVFDVYINQLIQFITELAKKPEYANAKIRLQAFGTELAPVFEKTLAEKDQLIAYLGTLRNMGQTHLNKAVLSEMRAVQSMPDITGSIAIFTDGEDSGQSLEVTENLNKDINALKSNGNPAKIFVFGLGKDYNAKKSEELAHSTGGNHHRLADINAFEAMLSSHLDDYCRARRLVRFIEDQTNKMVTVAVKEGEIAVSPQTFSIAGAFSVNGGATYSVKRGKQPLATSAPVSKLGQFKAPPSTQPQGTADQLPKEDKTSCLTM